MVFRSSGLGSPLLLVPDGTRNDKRRGVRPQARDWDPRASPPWAATCWHRILNHQNYEFGPGLQGHYEGIYGKIDG